MMKRAPPCRAGGRTLVSRRLPPCRAGFDLGMAAAHLLQQEVTVEGTCSRPRRPTALRPGSPTCLGAQQSTAWPTPLLHSRTAAAPNSITAPCSCPSALLYSIQKQAHPHETATLLQQLQELLRHATHPPPLPCAADTCPAGVLHVSVAQARTCLERFEDIDTLGSAAPPLPSLEDVLAVDAGAAAAGDAGGSQQALKEACCLATPAEAVEVNSGPLQDGGSSTLARLQGPRTGNATDLTSTHRSVERAGSVARSQALGGQCVEVEGAAAAHPYTSAALEEALQASEAIRRQRRRALIRLLREGRSTLASLGSSLSSIASWDDADQESE